MRFVTGRIINCNKFETEIAPARKPMLKRSEGEGSVSVLMAMVAVVETENVASTALLGVLCVRCNRLHAAD